LTVQEDTDQRRWESPVTWEVHCWIYGWRDRSNGHLPNGGEKWDPWKWIFLYDDLGRKWRLIKISGH